MYSAYYVSSILLHGEKKHMNTNKQVGIPNLNRPSLGYRIPRNGQGHKVKSHVHNFRVKGYAAGNRHGWKKKVVNRITVYRKNGVATTYVS